MEGRLIIATVGVVCGFDQGFKSFETCINCHETFQNSCHAPVELIKIMRDNMSKRENAGLSATTLAACPRAKALLDVYDYYEPLISGWNKSRGEWVHAMLETHADEDPEEVIRERRLYKDVIVDGISARITGKSDKVYTKQGVLIDFKSKESLPKRHDTSHEFQFNIYAWLWNGGRDILTDEQYNVMIQKGGMHYVTWKTKIEAAFKKVGYPIWPLAETEALIIKRARPLIEWKRTGTLPKCNPYVPARYWLCDCVKIANQLEERGIEIVEQGHAP